MEGNAIEEFPVEVGEWTEMQGMNLSNNKLTTFPAGIFNMKQLTYLDLSGNNITGNLSYIFIHCSKTWLHILYQVKKELMKKTIFPGYLPRKTLSGKQYSSVMSFPR